MDELITISLTLPRSKLTSVYALLGGAAPIPALSAIPGNSIPAGYVPPPPSSGAVASVGTAASSAASSAPTPAAASQSAGTGPNVTNTASPSDGVELDAAGVAWDPERHAATKSKTKAGLWRMKVGVTRPDNEGESSPSYANPSAEPAASAPPPPPATEDDEFAAFRAAASAETPPPPPAGARTWTDADLSKLCNQAALASGDPEQVKAIIAKYTVGEVPHSRNVPAEKRETFAHEIELAFGIQYAAG